MCGIVGIFSSDRQCTPSQTLLLDMVHTIRHRGPDAQKVWVTDGVGLAHARLSIIDLYTSADQPMFDKETGNVIVFNGEIYNYIELKSQLTQKGHVFYTKSDTEVILKAYAEWGVDCLNHFNGMFAFALYDTRAKKLFCARDRLGIKPFVYGMNQEHGLVFASEAKAIVQHLSAFHEVNHQFLKDFVSSDFFACYKQTFYKRLFNLLPGHYFVVQSGDVPIQRRYWDWKPGELKSIPKKEAVDTFRELLLDAIKLRFRSDVTVGSCLSGGLDSGTIVGLATAHSQQRLNTFSCVFPNMPAFDESEYIKASVKQFNTSAFYVEPKHDDLIQLMHTLSFEQDGPTGGPSVLSQRAVMGLAGQHVKVLLDGQGADELLGGYHGYFYHSLLTHMRQLKNKKDIGKLVRYLYYTRKVKNRLRHTPANFAALMKAADATVQFHTRNIQDTQLGVFNVYEQDDLNSVLLEHVFTNLTNLLHYEDRNSMRFSVESRLPFLDYRLVEYAFSLPHDYKIRGHKTKWLLTEVARDVLPKKVFNRKDKMGFTSPGYYWLKSGDNLNYFKRFITKRSPLYAWLPPETQSHFATQFDLLSNSQDTTAVQNIDINGLWRLITASMWFEQSTQVASSKIQA